MLKKKINFFYRLKFFLALGHCWAKSNFLFRNPVYIYPLGPSFKKYILFS